jgi:hypothetical protein
LCRDQASDAEDTCCDSSIVVSLAPARRRRAWRLAAEHLNARGLAACVPPEHVAYLERHGLEVWAARRAARRAS